MKQLIFTDDNKQLFELIYLWYAMPSDPGARPTSIEGHRQAQRILDAFASIGTLFYDEQGDPRPGAIALQPGGGTIELEDHDIAKLKASVEKASTVPAFSHYVLRAFDFLEAAS